MDVTKLTPCPNFSSTYFNSKSNIIIIAKVFIYVILTKICQLVSSRMYYDETRPMRMGPMRIKVFLIRT